MGRLSEFFDYLNVDPEDLAERKMLYSRISIDDEMKKIRREFLAEKRKRQNNDR